MAGIFPSDSKITIKSLLLNLKLPQTSEKISDALSRRDIKRREDIHPQGTCGLPIDMETRRVIETNWEVQIVYVEFADGMRWTPQTLTPGRQTAVDACS
jgi:hypothetical protein